ncbi:MAG TPA: (d)CMP kinase [Anaerolineae bacterium]|nr:(d)CMP kinase [Anaerolineae bacterium]
MDKNIDVIAIDGPAASGKSTVARLVAEKLGYLYLDTGCMYRAVTLAALQAGIDVADEMAVTQLTQQMEIEVLPAQDEGDGRHYTTLLNGKDVTWDLRLPEVDANVSQVASYKGVREELVRRQRAYGRRGHVVMVGRDIGTVVMPDAPLKLYITASPEERARRRWLDRQKQGFSDDFDAILADVIRRDRIDSNRQHSPLRPADDVIIMDTTERSVAEIVDEIVGMAASGVR